MKKLEEKEKFYIASKAFDKGWDYETLKYGDDLYGKEEETQSIWEIVEEIKDIGRIRFYEIYGHHGLY